jgi:hypothetical protein
MSALFSTNDTKGKEALLISNDKEWAGGRELMRNIYRGSLTKHVKTALYTLSKSAGVETEFLDNGSD